MESTFQNIHDKDMWKGQTRSSMHTRKHVETLYVRQQRVYLAVTHTTVSRGKECEIALWVNELSKPAWSIVSISVWQTNNLHYYVFK